MVTSEVLSNLNNIYKDRAFISTRSTFFKNIMISPIKGISTFSKQNPNEPLKITGRLITAGTYPDKDYGQIVMLPEELKASMHKWLGVKGYTNHLVYKKIMTGESVSVNEVVGKIVNVFWNDKDNAVDFDAEITDTEITNKIINGLIQYVSVGFARDIIRTDKSFVVKNISPREWSFVFKPRDHDAAIRVKN